MLEQLALKCAVQSEYFVVLRWMCIKISTYFGWTDKIELDDL